MATATTKTGSAVERWAWTFFVLMGVFILLIGVGDFTSSGADQTLKEDGLNELFIGALGIAVAAGGLRRGERWAWLTTALWPLWIATEGIRTLSAGNSAEAILSGIFLVLALAALALSYRRSFGTAGRVRGEAV